MKEICSLFRIVSLADSTPDELISDSLTIDLKSENGDAGLIYSVNQDIVIDKVTDNIFNKYKSPTYCLLLINYTDGTHTVYGSIEYPVVAYITRGIQRDTLTISLQTTDSPII